MKTTHVLLSIMLVLSTAPLPAPAADREPATLKPDARTVQAPARPVAAVAKGPAAALVYRPPLRGAPAARVGGGSRGVDETLPSIEVLAPDHTGLTLSAQPTLYWFLSRPSRHPIEITLIEERVIDPVLELTLEPTSAGIQALPLARHGLSLKPGVEYQWVVALVLDPAQRSRDILASALIRRVQAEAVLKGGLESAAPEERLRLYAEAGIWYDLIDTLSEAIAARPDDAELRGRRAMLLEQAGLLETTAFERPQGRATPNPPPAGVK